MIDRRQFLRAALFVAAAPIIVKAANIMPVRAPKLALPRSVMLIDPADWIDLRVKGWDHTGAEIEEVVRARHDPDWWYTKVNFSYVESLTPC